MSARTSPVARPPDSATPRMVMMEGRMLPPTPGKFQCFPRERWSEEFALARDVPLDGIEWIYDLHGVGANPLEDDAGVARMRELCVRHAVAVRSLCADYFMDLPLVRVPETSRAERRDRLRWLIGRCAGQGIGRVVLPFVDASRIESPADADAAVRTIGEVLPDAEAAGVELHLETSLGPVEFAGLLARLEHPLVKVNYDAGNSAALGYRPREEFSAYGERVGSVHIKDRVLGGGSVALGTGDVDFSALRDCLLGVGYDGEFVLQVARGEPGAEVSWARQMRRFAAGWWSTGDTPRAPQRPG